MLRSYNGFGELAAYLRHVEDTMWHAPVIWHPQEIAAAAAVSGCAGASVQLQGEQDAVFSGP